MIRFASLGSGSSGNAMLAQCGKTCLMIDCGFSAREAEQRMQRLGWELAQLSGVVVTHEHTDHIGGVFRLARKCGVPVYLTGGTYAAYRKEAELADCVLIDSHSEFAVGDFLVCPYPVPHDAREPIQLVLSDGDHRLGILTDVGEITPHIVGMLTGCHGLVLECNHDLQMLARSTYPAMLKRRIAGRLGHLDNMAAAQLLRQLDTSRLRHLVAAHLSERNNLPQLAVGALAAALGCAEEWIGVACQEQGFDWRGLG